LIPYYDTPEKLRKLDHGVDSNFFFPTNKRKDEPRLVCVGGGDDRKGFHLAIQAAHKLNMPITIVGPDSIHENYNDIFYKVLSSCKKDIEIVQTGNVDKNELRKINIKMDFILSIIKVLTEVLLNPYFSSI